MWIWQYKNHLFFFIFIVSSVKAGFLEKSVFFLSSFLKYYGKYFDRTKNSLEWFRFCSHRFLTLLVAIKTKISSSIHNQIGYKLEELILKNSSLFSSTECWVCSLEFTRNLDLPLKLIEFLISNMTSKYSNFTIRELKYH